VPTAENPFVVSERAVENARVRVEFDDDGFLDSVYDKDSDREVLDGPGNELVLYEDLPLEYEAWDIEEDVYRTGAPLPGPTSVEVVESGPARAVVRQRREFGDSTCRQDVVLYRDSKRIDFETVVEWHESRRLLKTHFPLAVHTDEATYEVQFGHHTQKTHANTSWDAARFEEPHQKWVNVSEHGYGIALLNDCKYGVHADGTDLSLSLLRAPISPDPEADRGTHRFTYSLYPHEGTLQVGGVVEAAYELNAPVQTVPVSEPVETSALELDTPGIVLEALKRAEDDPNELVCRLYEAWGRRTDVDVTFGFPVEAAREANLIEDAGEALGLDGDRLSLEFDPFQIKTVVLRVGG
jgi:alpha-mannosidase